MSRLRITGLVKLMNHVRESLLDGIAPGEEENFRAMVKENLRQVEEICRVYGTTPEKLPPQSYRAYRYLKELDLRHLPVAKKPSPPAEQRLRVKNLIASCKAIQQELYEITLRDKKKRKSSTIKDPQVMILLVQIRQLAQQVEKMVQKSGGTASNLSHQSRRAYQWLRFLSEGNNLEQHLATLHSAQAEIEALVNQPKFKPRYSGVSIRFELYNQPAVYRVSQQADLLLIEAHEGFVGAPVEVLHALALVALVGKGSRSLSKVKAYAQTEAFLNITSSLEDTSSPTVGRSKGRYFDLQQIFERVNQAYFNGQMEKPALMWNKTLTHRKFGHYQANTDTIMVSISLDKAATPAYVLEYVMYHELLHKLLGVVTNNGRRYAHTKAFRDAEARFPKQKQAEAYLNELSTNLSKGKSWKPKK